MHRVDFQNKKNLHRHRHHLPTKSPRQPPNHAVRALGAHERPTVAVLQATFVPVASRAQRATIAGCTQLILIACLKRRKLSLQAFIRRIQLNLVVGIINIFNSFSKNIGSAGVLTCEHIRAQQNGGRLVALVPFLLFWDHRCPTWAPRANGASFTLISGWVETEKVARAHLADCPFLFRNFPDQAPPHSHIKLQQKARILLSQLLPRCHHPAQQR